MQLNNQYWREYDVKRGKRELKFILPAIADRGFVAGSFAAYCAAPGMKPMKPNDIDIFATTIENAVQIVNRLEPHWRLFTSNDLTYTLHPGTGFGRDVQVIRPNPAWKQWPEDLLNGFDFDVCRAVVVAPDKVVADENVGSYTAKLLRINNPLRSLKRTLKYHKRGVDFPDRELVKLLLAWEQMAPERKAEILEGIKRADEEEAQIREENAYANAMAFEPYDFDEDDDYFEGE